MPVTVIYDACVLYPNTVRDVLIRVAQAGLVRARRSDQILDEMLGALARGRPDIPMAKLNTLRTKMNSAIRDCRVEGHLQLVDGLDLPDNEDRHVLAAAIASGSEIIVTANIRDFPSATLAHWHIVAMHPDEFLLDLIDLDAKVVWACLQQIADSRRSPPQNIEDVVQQLERSGLIEACAALRVW